MNRKLSSSDQEMVNNFYNSLGLAGIRYVKLAPMDKRVPKGSTWERSVLRKPEDAISTLESGFNVGLLLTGKNGIYPNDPGLFVLDKDSDLALNNCDFSKFNMMISRGHPEKAHYYSVLQDFTLPRRSRHIHGSHDVKLTGIVVGPGSQHKDGGVYRVFTRLSVDQDWVPWNNAKFEITDLPSLDPMPFMLLENRPILRMRQSFERLQPIWREAIGEADEWSGLNYVCNGRPPNERVHRAKNYVINRINAGYVSRSGQGGRATLLVLATHLRVYLGLDMETSYHKLTVPLVHGHSWNDLCCYALTGSPFPWSDAELRSALVASEELIPGFGVLEFQRLEEQKNIKQFFEDFLQVINRHASGSYFFQQATAMRLHKSFLAAYSLSEDQVNNIVFGRMMKDAVDNGRVSLQRKVTSGYRCMAYHGFGINHLVSKLVR